MEMINDIYEKISYPFTVFEICMIYRYIYGFSIQKVRKVILAAILMVFVLGLFMPSTEKGTELALTVTVFLCMAVFFLSVPKKRLRQMLWIFPSLAAGIVPVSMLWLFFRIFMSNSSGLADVNPFDIIGDIFLLVFLLILYYLDKKYHFTRCIKRNERFSICITSFFIVTVSLIFVEGNIVSVFGKYTSITVLGVWIGLALLLWIMIKMLIKGTYAQYYMEINKNNEKIIEMQMQHFETYKKTQEEIQKMRHDMKNHLACMKILLDAGKEEELKAYLEEMIETVSWLSPNIQTNIDIVDAIIGSKYQEAKAFNISIQVDGKLSFATNVKAIDWCKIFANAIDNGMEALRKLEDKENKILTITIEKSSNFVLIRFENQCKSQVKIENRNVHSHKEDPENHGFGLENIRSAVKNYSGDMNLFCQEKKGDWYFITEVLIPTHEACNSSHR
ncbi:sensor histidine kinase [Marinisporobacter balticus]|uniref:GHKL domain-containing protein n=1 Tax=Marinisporobacter balticus TaxID=2018667 RepID=A0A4V2SAS7_9FIRM|nr:ATP-binding protein [Marinisporobacter balticus]TCO72190.1 GHKL domain-containing protein [Marinisporobacter balticus]